MRLGFIVVLVGVLYLLLNTHLIAPFAWSTLWPIIVILIGIAMIGRQNNHGRWCDCRMCMKRNYDFGAYAKHCNCDCEGCKNCEIKR